MDRRKSRMFVRFWSFCLAVLLLALPLLAQETDPDPNSPTPVLLSESDSTRALAVEKGSLRRGGLAKVESRAFSLDSKIEIFVTNLDLMKGEGANAFRVYGETKDGRQYRFPVLEIKPVSGQEWIYSVVVYLKDEIGYWMPPAEDGDIYLRLTWRGLSSNLVRLGLGKIGGNFKDAEDARPTPYKEFSAKPLKSASTENYVGYRWSGDRRRFAEQAAFGSTEMFDSRLRRIGLRTWLADQFTTPYPSANNPYPDLALKSSNVDIGCPFPAGTPERRICSRDFYTQYQLQNWFFKEAFYGEPQLRHRVAWALGQFWVTSGTDIQQASHMIAYHKVLSKNAFGKYDELMKEMTLNPTMGEYLDMARSTRTSPNENYPREILQLFSIGLFMLNQDGTLQLDGQGNPIPTYDQTTVNNFTKVFTGWSFCNNGANPACPNFVTGTVNYKDPLLLNPNNHDLTEKALLSYPGSTTTGIAACTNCTTADARTSYANRSLNQAIQNIFEHPNVAPFVSKILIQHLVTSDPTPAYVGRVAAAFNDNGSGVRGDLKAVVRAILLDPEARGDVKTDPNFGKLREPVQLMTNVMRTFNVRSADGTQPSDGVVSALASNMAQNPFYAPTVFNYYAPDYVIPGTTMLGPEFYIMTTGTAISRANFANTMVFSRINTGQDAPQGTSIDLTEMQALAAADPTGNQLLDALNQRMMHGAMSAAMRSRILTAVQAVPAASTLARAQQAIYLVATSSQYQVQR